MYRWVSLCLLVVAQHVIFVHQWLCTAYKQLLQRFAGTVDKPTGIRPAAPRCIALALNDPDFASEELHHLTKVLKWCVKAGLQHAIVYDGPGRVKQNTDSLGITTAFGDKTRTYHLEGCPSFSVSLLSQEDSLSPLVSAVTQTRRPACTADNCQAEVHQHQTAAMLGNKLQQIGSSLEALIEPDVMLVFGEAFTLGGYPPWPIRVTEMYHMGRLRHVSSKALQATLQQYSSTLQRFGT